MTETDAPVQLPPSRSQELRRFVRQQIMPLIVMLLVLLAARSSLADWNEVPSGSMNPTILEGDRIFVNKLAYGLKVPFTTWHLARWGTPQRGEVVVFFAPHDGTRMVKRVLGVPGDEIEIENNHLIVNGEHAEYLPTDPDAVGYPASRAVGSEFATENLQGQSHPVMFTPGQRGKPFFGRYVVPQGEYLLIGDNRDNSFDSRFWGTVKEDQIVGRSSRVVAAFDPAGWFKAEWSRFGKELP